MCGFMGRKVKEKENKKIRMKRMSGEKRCGPHCKEQVGHQESWRSFKGGNALNNFALYSLCRVLAIFGGGLIILF